MERKKVVVLLVTELEKFLGEMAGIMKIMVNP